MKTTLFRLCLIPALAFVCSLSAGSVQRSQAEPLPCWVNHFGCQEEFIDCCCGYKTMCAGSQAQCDAFCS